ncbi:MAG TPA: glycosyltransferase family 2 protein [Candidatus Acidoferrum sp.]|nr:glycosyltransferase family 2 protein [Candidatus Acidoferrum sp.]
MLPDTPTVSIVVLNWNGKRHLSAALESLVALDYPQTKLEIVLCDNGSADGSADFVRQRFPSVRVVALDRNYGFAEGNNRAARLVSGEWIGFLNNDMWVEPSWLQDLLAPLAEQPQLKCLASRIKNWDGSALDFIGGGVSFHGHGFQRDHGETSSIHDQPRRLLFPCGGAMLIKRDLFLEVGGFDPDFFAFFEDVDLGWRLNLLGHDVWYTPAATAFHRHHSTAHRIDPHQLGVLYERNALAMIYKCFDDGNLAAVLPMALLLLNERALEHARVDRSAFAIPGSEAAEEVTTQVMPSNLGSQPAPTLVARGRKILREQGVGVAAAKALRQPGKWTLAGLRPIVEQLRPKHFLVPAMAMSYWVGASEFAHQLETLNTKRAWIQSRRKRSDAEIIPLFVDPFYANYPDPNFHRFTRWLVRVQGLDHRFGAVPD